MRPHVVAGNSHLGHVTHHDIGVHAARRKGACQRAGTGRADTPEQWAIRFLSMAAGGQVLGYQAQCIGMGRQVAQLAALALHPQVPSSATALAQNRLCEFRQAGSRFLNLDS